ncbi:MAG TPA: ABC transporter substrate-binding protein [Xanthobacteraceae bacterium]|jgi:ABC-type nitrate/sulfonate/bicarbonate transport system substrate-binding protein
MRTQALRSTALGLLALAATAFGSGGGACAADVIRYGIDDDQNINRLPQVVAEREGFFAREGVEVRIVPFTVSFRAPPGANPISMRDAMSKGDIDMSREQFPLLINDVMAGRKFAAASVASGNPLYFVVARPEIQSFADLKGKTLTITNPRDGITIWTRKLMAMHGLADGDVMLMNIAGSKGRLACLKSAECAAASLAQPAVLDAVEAGSHILGLTNEIGPPLYQFDIVDPSRAAANREAIVKYIRATTAAVRFIQDPTNRDEIVKVTMGYMKEPENRSREMLTAIWDPKNRVLPQRATIDMEGVKAAISLLGEYDILKQPLPAPERFIDPAYAEAASR